MVVVKVIVVVVVVVVVSAAATTTLAAAAVTMAMPVEVEIDDDMPEQRAVEVRIPEGPTEEQTRLHCLAHLSFQPWCPVCIQPKGTITTSSPSSQDRGQEEI